jgi:hypothetical protein
MRILTWHIHGSYLYSLVHARHHELFLPTKPGQPHGYGGRAGPFAWPDNVHEVAFDEVKDLELDLVLFQSKGAYLEDRHRMLSAEQQRLPRIYLEHEPPRETPTDTKHFLDDPRVLLVHVTHFNDLMWDSNRTPTHVIEHGVAVPDDLVWEGDLDRGIVVVNDLRRRGRRLGADVFERVLEEIPLDLAGMGSSSSPGMGQGALGDLPLPELWRRETRYRFFFNPIRYTSMGMAVCEAMMIGLPVIALATTEMPSVIDHGVSGYVSNDVGELIEHMRRLLDDPTEAAWLGENARSRPARLRRRRDEHLAHLAARGLGEREEHAARDVGGIVEELVGAGLEARVTSVEERRAHAAGDEHRHAHLALQLEGERAREAHDAELARAVRRRGGERAQAERRRHGHDLPARLLEPGQRRADDGGGAEEVHHHGAIPPLAVDVGEVAGPVHRRACHHGVDAPELVAHATHRRLGVARAREVHELDVVRGLLAVEALRGLAIDDHGARTGRLHLLHHGGAEAGRSPGDDDDLVLCGGADLNRAHDGPPAGGARPRRSGSSIGLRCRGRRRFPRRRSRAPRARAAGAA